jgi:hypothetical protein
VVVDDPQDLDEAKGGRQPPQGRLLLGVDLGHGRPATAVAARRVGPQMQVDPAALELELVVILGRTVQLPCEQRCCVMDGVLNGR